MNCKPGRHENQWTVSHRMTGSPEYASWQAMRGRCLRPQDKDYVNYGARGIAICSEWDNFETFFADMGPRPDGLTLERRENDGPYCAANCYWATPTQQTRNRRNAINVAYQGEVRPLKVWCDAFGINYFTAHRKLRREGKSAEQVFGGPR